MEKRNGAITAIIDSISFSISRDFRRHYRQKDRLRTLDSSPGAFSIHFPHNPFTVSIEAVLVCKGGTHGGVAFSRKTAKYDYNGKKPSKNEK